MVRTSATSKGKQEGAAGAGTPVSPPRCSTRASVRAQAEQPLSSVVTSAGACLAPDAGKQPVSPTASGAGLSVKEPKGARSERHLSGCAPPPEKGGKSAADVPAENAVAGTLRDASTEPLRPVGQSSPARGAKF